MILGLHVNGATESSVLELLELAVRRNERFYRSRPDAVPIHELGVVYVPDRRSAHVLLVAAECLVPGAKVSCGTAASAWVAWRRARGFGATVEAKAIDTGVWHTVGVEPASRIVWDPAIVLPRARRRVA